MSHSLDSRYAGPARTGAARHLDAFAHALRGISGATRRLPGNARRKAAFAVAGLAVAAGGWGATSILARYDPALFGFYPRCPLFVLTGLYCPGCGVLRASHQLLHGNLLGALDYNPVFVVAAPILVYALLSMALERTTGATLPAPRISGRASWAVAALIIGFGVLRNLPYPPFTVLAP